MRRSKAKCPQPERDAEDEKKYQIGKVDRSSTVLGQFDASRQIRLFSSIGRSRTFLPGLKDLRRLATRYDKLAHNYHPAVGPACLISYWL